MAKPADAEALAQKAAEEWLLLVEGGDAGKTWARGSRTFREALDEETWARSLHAAQAGMGRPLERTLRSAEYAAELPGAADGHYVVFTYDTRFERKRNGTETVVCELDPDGAWRVSGYFVR